MANLSNLNVNIGANLAGLRSGLKNASKQITSFSEGVESRLGSVSVGNLDRQIQNIGQSSLQAVPSANKLASSLKNVQRPAARTTSAVVNFNRVIQDAPFGIIGVANNLEPMISSFNQLRDSTGSTTGAFKTLLKGAFTGPGALITVVSVASSLLVAFSGKLRGSGDAAEDTERQLSGLNNEIDVMVKAIDKIQDFDDPFGLASLENELRAIQSRESVLKTQRDRLREINEEAREIEDFAFGDKGEVLNPEAAAQFRELQAQAKAIAEDYGTTAEITAKLEELSKNRLETQQELNTTQSALNSGLVKEAEARSQLLDQLEQQARLTEEDIVPADLPSVAELMQFDTVNMQVKELGRNAPLATNNLQGGLERASGAASSMREAMGPLNEDLTQTGELGAFVGSRIGEAFAQAAIFADSLSESLKNIGKQLASRAIVNFLSLAFSPGGLAGLFGGGIGGFFKGLLKFHSGGTVPGPIGKERLVLAKGGETIRTPSQESTFGRGNTIHITGEFRQRGTELVAVIDQTKSGTLR